MELYKKLQINKKITNEKFTSKLRIKNQNKNFNHNRIPSDILNLSKYQLHNTQIDEGKSNIIKKSNFQPVNFYISSINKVYNNTDRSINISQPNTQQKLINGRKNNYFFKNKGNPINQNINNTYQIKETNYSLINNNINNNRNSLKKHILNYKVYADNNNNLPMNKINNSLNKSNDTNPLNKLIINQNIIHNLRSHSGENKKKFINKQFLSLIRKAKASFDKKNLLLKKQKLNNIKRNTIGIQNYIVTNNQLISRKNNNMKGKINLKKNKINEKLKFETLDEINNSYIPYTCREQNGKSIKLKNYKMNHLQTYNKNKMNKKLSEDKKKLKLSFFSNLKNEINNDAIDKSKRLKSNIFNFITLEQPKSLKIHKNMNCNKNNIKTLECEPCLTYRKMNNNYNRNNNILLKSQNNIFDLENNNKIKESNYKDNDRKHKNIPFIYKKRTAMSPFANNLQKIFLKKEMKKEKEKQIKKIRNPITKTKTQFNLEQKEINKLNNNFNQNNNQINKNFKNKREINQSKSCHTMIVEPNINNSFLLQTNSNKNPTIFSSQKYLNNINKKYIEIIKNSSICKGGENYPYEKKKINQDNIFKTKFDELDISYYGVCDGHGDNGHLVSEFIKDNLPLIMYKEIRSLFYLINNNENNNNQDKEQTKAYFSEICKQSFDILNKKLISNKNIDSSLSGSTCISLLFYEDLIISANLGDSRAIMGKLIDNKWVYELLSRDHKPSEIDEVLRIKYKNGEIHPFLNEDGSYSGPNRVWIKGQGIPGLAMTRSFGDIIGSTVGIISEPEIKFFNYEKENKFIIIGSDGLWEYISCQEAVNIVGEFYHDNDLDSDSGVIKLFQTARNKWIENQNCIDDISIIILFLE